MTRTAKAPENIEDSVITTETEAVTEDSLRALIAALDKKITNQKKHIDKLVAELATKRTERGKLMKQRIELLQRELPEEDDPNA